MEWSDEVAPTETPIPDKKQSTSQNKDTALSKEQKELVRPFAIPKPTREIVFVTRKDFIRHTVAGILIESIKKAVPKEMLTLQPGQKVV